MKRIIIWIILIIIAIIAAMGIALYADLIRIDRSDIIRKYKTDPLFCRQDRDCAQKHRTPYNCPEPVNIFQPLPETTLSEVNSDYIVDWGLYVRL